MKFLKQLCIFAVLVGIGFAALNIRFTERAPRLVDCRPESVTAVQFQHADHVLRLERVTGKRAWQVAVGKLRSVAQQKIADSVAHLVCRVPYVESFEAVGREVSSLASYGLETPSRRITVFGETTSVLTIGNETPAGTEYFVAVSDHPDTVFTVSNGYITPLFPKLMDLWTRTPLAELDSARVDLVFRDWPLQLQWRDGRWEEASGRLTPQVAAQVIESLQSLYYEKYHGPLGEDQLVQYGATVPDLTAHVETDQGQADYAVTIMDQLYYLILHIGDAQYALILDPIMPQTLFQQLALAWAAQGNS